MIVARNVHQRPDIATLLRVATLRIGVLGAASITPAALIKPARSVPEVEIAAVAARDPARAAAFAAKQQIPQTFPSYAELLSAPGISAVYIPLPNALHAEWTLRAIAAGKHVLCEKPMTSNAAEAAEVTAAAERAGVVVMEAFHYRYHPLTARILELVPELGELRHIETRVAFPLPKPRDIRFSYELGGGAMMDAGCYAVHALRTFSGQQPEVVAARATLRSPQVDRAMVADYAFPRGATGRTVASLWSRHVLALGAKIVGERGAVRVFNFVLPQLYHRLAITIDGRTRHERVDGDPTYTYQLRAFAAAVAGGPNLTPAADAVTTMQLIDDVYTRAGLKPRG
jgi:predicted dehydrogenase